MVVLDASVAVKWIFQTESQAEKARSVLNRLVSLPEHFFVPDLFFIEMASVLVKKRADNDLVSSGLNLIFSLGIQTIPVGKELLLSASQVALKYHLSVYDGIYVATARSLGGKWLTADVEAVAKLSTKWAIKLEDFK